MERSSVGAAMSPLATLLTARRPRLIVALQQRCAWAAPRGTRAGMIRRLSALREALGVDEPTVFILAPATDRPVPAGDVRRGTAWIFRQRTHAVRFAAWVNLRHGLATTPIAVELRALTL